MPVRAPSIGAVRAFGVHDRSLSPLPGGQGTAWSDGRLVLKPVGYPREHAWACEVYARWTASDVIRVPVPVRSGWDGSWVVEGWGAHVFVVARDADLDKELDVVRAASETFHAYASGLPRPAFMDDRADPWSFGDRVAWEDKQPEGDADTLALLNRLRAARRPVLARSQVIHGDILPNVLIAPGLPPAVIDWPPYFRPVALSLAIAATDAVTFHGTPMTLFDDWASGDDWNQLLIRALLYRLGTTGWFTARDRVRGTLRTHTERASEVVEAVLARAREAV
jgi:uncharacterized protein (TIGR02569 family)